MPPPKCWITLILWAAIPDLNWVTRRFGVHEPNISPWRRAVCGDMTSAFDFAQNDPSLPKLPDTSEYRHLAEQQCKRPVAARAPEALAPGAPPTQEAGVRPARPLPYVLDVRGHFDPAGSAFVLEMAVGGRQAAVFWVHDLRGGLLPRSFTVEPGKSLQDRWPLSDAGRYALEVRGPNGFFRSFTGQVQAAVGGEASAEDDGAALALRLKLRNAGDTAAVFMVTDLAYGLPMQRLHVPAGGSLLGPVPLATSSGWYDLLVERDGDADFARRLAGHVESGKVSTSDPAMA